MQNKNPSQIICEGFCVQLTVFFFRFFIIIHTFANITPRGADA